MAPPRHTTAPELSALHSAPGLQGSRVQFQGLRQMTAAPKNGLSRPEAAAASSHCPTIHSLARLSESGGDKGQRQHSPIVYPPPRNDIICIAVALRQSIFMSLLTYLIITSSLLSSLTFRALHFLAWFPFSGSGARRAWVEMGFSSFYEPWQMNALFCSWLRHVYFSCINFKFMFWRENAADKRPGKKHAGGIN